LVLSNTVPARRLLCWRQAVHRHIGLPRKENRL
jgi:hypothetical protein